MPSLGKILDGKIRHIEEKVEFVRMTTPLEPGRGRGSKGEGAGCGHEVAVGAAPRVVPAVGQERADCGRHHHTVSVEVGRLVALDLVPFV